MPRREVGRYTGRTSLIKRERPTEEGGERPAVAVFEVESSTRTTSAGVAVGGMPLMQIQCCSPSRASLGVHGGGRLFLRGRSEVEWAAMSRGGWID